MLVKGATGALFVSQVTATTLKIATPRLHLGVLDRQKGTWTVTQTNGDTSPKMGEMVLNIWSLGMDK